MNVTIPITPDINTYIRSGIFTSNIEQFFLRGGKDQADSFLGGSSCRQCLQAGKSSPIRF
jgi:hypothetical protein